MSNVIKHPNSPKLPSEMTIEELRGLSAELGIGILALYVRLKDECPDFLDSYVSDDEDCNITQADDFREMLQKIFPGQLVWQGNRIIEMKRG